MNVRAPATAWILRVAWTVSTVLGLAPGACLADNFIDHRVTEDKRGAADV